MFFTGAAGAVLPYVRLVWRKTFGVCLATELLGAARIAERKTGLEISK
jgi:hypothetical protein